MQQTRARAAHRRRRGTFPLAMLLAAVMAIGGAAGVIRAANARTSDVERIDGLAEILQPQDGPAVNYLLIGSDTREGSDPNSPDFGGIGDTDAVQGRRSDTIMILRQEQDGDGATLLSLPRDLWVDIVGRESPSRINAAYSDGADVLAATITQELGIPIHHVVDIDFFGFKDVVDAIGGSVVCFEYVTRDRNTGLDQQPGCNVLDGTQALAYARSRHFEEFRDGQWQEDPSADLGRIARQQEFIRTTADSTIQRLASDPFKTSELIDAVSGSLRLDAGLDPLGAAGTLRKAFSEGLTTYQLPVEGTTIGGNAVLVLLPGAEPILAYFRGDGPAPLVGS
ncbi:MAG: LCP family protein [Acidimicrobiia bacterium]|nr:LCP family protein [Acidimicrobiia bacterium]